MLLGDDPGLTGPVTVRAPEAALTTLDAVLSDKAGMAALADVRARAIASVQPASPTPTEPEGPR